MNFQIERLKELIKTYTVAASVANATGAKVDRDRAAGLLNAINVIRRDLVVNAEMREIFYLEQQIPAAANANTVQNVWVSKNDTDYTFKRGIAALLNGVNMSLFNQGQRAIEITRQATAWQQLFSQYQNPAPIVGQQIPFDFPETLRFGENQSLGVATQGQTEDGYLWFHGATLKDNLEESSIDEICREFLGADGSTKYLPETQIVPLEFQFEGNEAGSPARNANGGKEIFSLKNDKSVLLTEVSTTAIDIDNKLSCRLTISDEGKNLAICDTVDVFGIAGYSASQFATYYPLPEPHLLRKGDRLKLKGLNAGVINPSEGLTRDTLYYLSFRGFTI
jgi:hypothetical protein